MKNKTTKNILIILFSSILLSGCNRLDNHQPLTTSTISLETINTKVSQTFKSSYNNLNIVYMCLRNPKSLTVPLEFRLYESTSSGRIVRTLPFNTSNINNTDCTRLQFNPITDSKNKQYLAEVEVMDTTGIRKELYIETSSDKEYENGTAYVNDKKANIDLHFKTLYKQGNKEVIQESISQFLKRILKDPVFIILYIAILFYTIRKLSEK